MTIFDKLQKYFNEMSKEQIQKDWNKTKGFDNVNTPTIKQFLLHGVGVPKAEQLGDKKEYCNSCGDYVGKGCDNEGCKDFKPN